MAAGTTTTSTPAWVQLLAQELEEWRPDPSSGKEEFTYIVTSLIKEYLFCEDLDAAAKFAHRFDDLYATVYEPTFNGYNKTHKGWTGYLCAFYESLFPLAMAMRYDDPLQDKVIDLFVELRKLPTHRVKIFVVSSGPNRETRCRLTDPMVDSNPSLSGWTARSGFTIRCIHPWFAIACPCVRRHPHQIRHNP
jgi:hypothetical protein